MKVWETCPVPAERAGCRLGSWGRAEQLVFRCILHASWRLHARKPGVGRRHREAPWLWLGWTCASFCEALRSCVLCASTTPSRLPQLNIANPSTGCMKVIEVDDEKQLYVHLGALRPQEAPRGRHHAPSSGGRVGGLWVQAATIFPPLPPFLVCFWGWFSFFGLVCGFPHHAPPPPRPARPLHLHLMQACLLRQAYLPGG
jgi:hypothetical protein